MHTHSHAHTVVPPIRVPARTFPERFPSQQLGQEKTTSSSYSRNKLYPRERGRRSEREREPRCLNAASAVRRRRERSIGRLAARSRRGEEGGRSAKQGAAERSTYVEPAFCRIPPCRVRCEVRSTLVFTAAIRRLTKSRVPTSVTAPGPV